MADISLEVEVMEILSDKYLFTNISTNFNDLDDQTLINIYLRIITVYDDINEYLLPDLCAQSAGEPPQEKKLVLKHIVRCIRPFDFSYLAPKTVCLLDRKKTLRIFSALHNEVQKRYGKALSQRVRMIMKREEIRNKNLHRKVGKMDSLPDTCSTYDATSLFNAEKILTVDMFIGQKDAPFLTPAKSSSSFNYVIPKGRQIPRTPFKPEIDGENVDSNRIMPPPSDFSDLSPDLNMSTECLPPPPPEFGDVKFIPEQPLSPPEKYKDNNTLENISLIYKQKDVPNKEALCSSDELSNVLVAELHGMKEDITHQVHEKRKSSPTQIHSDPNSETDSDKLCEIPLDYTDSCNKVFNSIPINGLNCKVRRETYCIPNVHSNSPVNDSELNSPICNLGLDCNDRLSDVAPLMFMEDTNLNNSPELVMNNDNHDVFKSRETYVVPQLLKSRETYVVPQPLNSKEAFVVSQPLISRETYVVPQPLKSRETYAAPQPLKSRETYVVSQPIKSRETFIVSQPPSSSDDSINDEGNLSQSVLETNNSLKCEVINKSIVNLKEINGKETIIQKIKVSPDFTSTTITEINYTGNKTVRHFPKGKELLRTPPSSDSSFADKSTSLDSTLNRSRNDLLVQIYLNKGNLTHLSEKNELLNTSKSEVFSKLNTTYTSGSEEASRLDTTSGSEELSKLDTTYTSASESDRDTVGICPSTELNNSIQYDDSLSIFPSKSFRTPKAKIIKTNKNVENVDDIKIENSEIKTNGKEKITKDDKLKVPESKVAKQNCQIKLKESTENDSQKLAELMPVESNRNDSSKDTIKEILNDKFSTTVENSENNYIKVAKEGRKEINKKDSLKFIKSNKKGSLDPESKFEAINENLKKAESGQESQKVVKKILKNKVNLKTQASNEKELKIHDGYEKESLKVKEKEFTKDGVLKTEIYFKDKRKEQSQIVNKNTNLKIADRPSNENGSFDDKEIANLKNSESTITEPISVGLAKEKSERINKNTKLKMPESKEKESIEAESIANSQKIVSENNKKINKNLKLQEINGKKVNIKQDNLKISEVTQDDSQQVSNKQCKRINKKANAKKGESYEKESLEGEEKDKMEDNFHPTVTKKKSKINNKKANLKVPEFKGNESFEAERKDETTIKDICNIPETIAKVSQKLSREHKNPIKKNSKEPLVVQEKELISRLESLKIPEAIENESQKVAQEQTKRIRRKANLKTEDCSTKMESLEDEVKMEANFGRQECVNNDSKKVVKKPSNRTNKNANLKVPETLGESSLEAKENVPSNEEDLKVQIPDKTAIDSQKTTKVQNVKISKSRISKIKENIEKASLQTNVIKEISMEQNLNTLENPIIDSQKCVREQRTRISRKTNLEIPEIKEDESLDPESKEESSRNINLKRSGRNRKIALEVKEADEINKNVKDIESVRIESRKGNRRQRNKIETKDNFEISEKNEDADLDEMVEENKIDEILRNPQKTLSKTSKSKRSKPICIPDNLTILENNETEEILKNVKISNSKETINNNLKAMDCNNKEILETAVESINVDDNVMILESLECKSQNGKKRTNKILRIPQNLKILENNNEVYLEPENIEGNVIDNVDKIENSEKKKNIVTNNKKLPLEENKNAINVKEMVNILESRSVEKKSLKERKKGTNNGEKKEVLDSYKKEPEKGKLVKSIVENFKTLQNSEAEKLTLKGTKATKNVKLPKNSVTDQNKKIGKSKKIRDVIEAEKENYAVEAEIDSELLQSANVRPSRRCKIKASEAIAKAMNDSL